MARGRMMFELKKEGRRALTGKRVQRLMRVMGIEALVPRPGTKQKAAPGHKIYPYLLRGLAIARARTTCGRPTSPTSPMAPRLSVSGGDQWIGPAALFWPGRLSNTIDARLLRRGSGGGLLLRHGMPKIFNNRPGRAIHQRRVHPANSKPPGNRDFDGRARPLHGQHFSSNGCGRSIKI